MLDDLARSVEMPKGVEKLVTLLYTFEMCFWVEIASWL